MIPYSRQLIEQDDIESVNQVLRSDFLTQGPVVEAFEAALCSYCGAQHAVIFSSGTAALHAAYFAAGIGKGDEVITSPITFAATANAALYLGARPVFTDVEPDTGNMASERLRQAVTRRTKAIAPVHYAGHPVDLQAISRVAKEFGLVMIEDACHALGAQYFGTRAPHTWTRIGSCAYSDMTVFSFHPVKQITTGEGGAVLTNCSDYCEKLRLFRTHGINKNSSNFKSMTDEACPTTVNGDWYYEMQTLGFNYRISDIHAALGMSQLRKLDRFVSKRRQIAERYRLAYAEHPCFETPPERSYGMSSYHLYPIRLADEFKLKKLEIFATLRASGLGVQVHYLPVYLHPYYQAMGYEQGSCPVAEDFYQKEISIPLYPGMDDRTVDAVINILYGSFRNR